MAAIVAVNFKVGGDDAVIRAIRTVSQSAQREGQRQVSIARSTERAKVSEAEASAKAVAKAAKDAAKEQTKAAKDAEKERSKIVAEGVAANLRTRKLELKSEIDFMRQAAKERSKLARETEREARKVKSIGNGVGRETLSGAGRGLRDAGGKVAAVGALAAGGIGLPMVLSAIEQNRDMSTRSALLQNSTGKGLDFTKISRSLSDTVGVDAGEIMGGLEGIGAKAGGGGIAALGGNEQEIIANYEKLAKVARGAGVSMKDLGDVTGTLINRGVGASDLVSTIESLVQQGKDGAVEFKDLATELDASTGALIRFKMGDTERVNTAGGLSQIARTYGRKSAAEATTAVTDLGTDLGQHADLIQQLTGGSITGVRMVGGKPVREYGGGVEVGVQGTNRAQLRNINDLLPDIIDKAIKHGNAGKLAGGVGSVFTGTSATLISPLLQAAQLGIKKDENGRFQIAKEGETAEAYGGAAVKKMLEQFEASDVKPGASAAAFENVMKSTGASFEAGVVKMKNQLADQLAPKMGELAAITSKVTGAFVSLASFAIDSPVKAIASFAALSMAVEGVKAGLSTLGSNALERMFSKAVPQANITAGVVHVSGPGVPGGAPGTTPNVAPKPGTPGVLGGGAVAFVGGALVGAALGETATNESDQMSRRERQERVDEADPIIKKLASGDATEADRERGRELFKKFRDQEKEGFFSRAVHGAVTANANAGEQLDNGNITAGNMMNNIGGLSLITGLFKALAAESDKADAKAAGDAMQQALSAGVRITNLNELVGRDATSQPINPPGGG